MIASLVFAAALVGAATESALEELVARVAGVAAADRGTYLHSPDAAAADAAAQSAAEAARTAGGGRNAPAAKGRQARHTWRVSFAPDSPSHYELGNAQFWRQGKRLVALTRREEWERLDASKRALWKSDGDAEQRALVRMVADLERIVAPAELLAELVTADAVVSKEPLAAASEGAPAPVEFVVTLPAAALERLLQPAAGRGARRAEEEGAPADAATGVAEAAAAAAPARGTLRVRVVGEAIVRLDLEASGPGREGDRALRRRWELVVPPPPFDPPPAAVVKLLAEQ
ncbi:MAG: hypothetical protein JNL90_10305 [Planctomycetes bacterium]|nr:hypothetical protein [Planctomycetota bacterium]